MLQNWTNHLRYSVVNSSVCVLRKSPLLHCVIWSFRFPPRFLQRVLMHFPVCVVATGMVWQPQQEVSVLLQPEMDRLRGLLLNRLLSSGNKLIFSSVALCVVDTAGKVNTREPSGRGVSANLWRGEWGLWWVLDPAPRGSGSDWSRYVVLGPVELRVAGPDWNLLLGQRGLLPSSPEIRHTG